MSKTTPLNAESHAKTKVKPREDFLDVNNQNFISLTADEFSSAASSFPIMLIKNGQNGQFHAIALTAFEEGQNLFCGQAGQQWEGVYIPKAMQRVPFVLGPDPDKENSVTTHLIDENPRVNEQDGQALFDESGQATGFLQGVEKQLADFYHMERATQQFIKALLTHNLLKEYEVLVRFASDRTKRIKGFYNIDEERLNSLSVEVAADFFKQGFFAPIYAMLSSVTQFNRLLRLQNNQSDDSIVQLNMRAAQEDEL
ncbi:SapC family protein [Alteromonas flava]|uniref:SapC family protein n=1 Tax=Alteromonas flava TaxID=2048003 RepID=UPI000C285E3F|nr:SapC family protein [Alteromonas flava]